MNCRPLILALVPAAAFAAVESPAWLDFTQKRDAGDLANSTLLDFSYAGYRFSEEEIPDVSTWNTIDVTSHGAIANDAGFDDAAIQAAIDAAEAAGVPTVVYFPAGRYKVSSATSQDTPIVISGSHIVLKGAGSGPGGTEIFSERSDSDGGAGPYRFQFKPPSTASSDITTITQAVNRGDYQIQVSSSSGLAVGQCVDLFQHTTANLPLNLPGLTYNPVWRIANNGIRPYEKHLITAISGNTVTFKNPVKLNFALDTGSSRVRSYNTLEEVGVEDIRFSGGWLDEPQIYQHHANDLVDYGWRALTMENVRNSWVRNCEFKDWNEALAIENSMAVTVKDCVCSGKQGHTSYYARYSYGVLFENFRDDVEKNALNSFAGQGHGPGMRWSSTGTVFLNCKMNSHQSIDCHGYHPYGNLLDGVYGGTFRGNGGTEESYPNSGPDLTFWNFIHASSYSTKSFNFWDTVNRQTHTYGLPKFFGFQSPGENITLVNTGVNQQQGIEIYPKSLFDAQLQLRLFDGYMSASSAATTNPARLANDNNPATFWSSNGPGAGQWLMLDLGVARPVDTVNLQENGDAVGTYVLEYWDESTWQSLASGSGIGAFRTLDFPTVTARKFRLTVVAMAAGQTSQPASIRSFGIVAPAVPQELTVFSASSDASVKENLQVVDDAGNTTLLGAGGSDPWVDRCTIYVFQLPDLGAVANPFDAADFTFHYSAKQNTLRNNDLYGLGRRPTNAVVGTDYYGQTATPDASDATLLESGILVDSSPFGMIRTSPAGSAALRNYLNEQYASGAGIGEFVFLRLNSAGPKDNIRRATLTMTEGAVSTPLDTRPRLELIIAPPPGESDLIARWSFNEGSGTTAADSSGNNHPGTLVNNPTWGCDETRGSFLTFNGSDQSVSTGLALPVFSASQDFTWSFWARNGNSSTNAVIVGNRHNGPGTADNSPSEWIKFTPTKFEYRQNGQQATLDYANLVTGEWHQHAIVKSGTSFQYYIDGAATGPAQNLTAIGQTPLPFFIGGHPGAPPSEHFAGSIDEVHLYGRALAPAEIAALALPDPNPNPDCDADGLPDAWEMAMFGGLAETPDGDTDGDGASNADEFAAGTHPADAESRFAIQSVAPASPAGWSISWESVTGRTYKVFRSSDLDSDPWTPVSGDIPGIGGIIPFTDSTATAPAAFYRVRVMPE